MMPLTLSRLARRELAENAVAQDLTVRDDGGERRAQIVRDVGEKLRAQRRLVAQLGDESRELKDLLLQRRESLGGDVIDVGASHR